MAFDPNDADGDAGALAGFIRAHGFCLSPDGKWIAFETARAGPKQIWVRNVASGTEEALTGGNCNSSSPAWELDSRSVIFASDCGRGIGLPSLYRARIDNR